VDAKDPGGCLSAFGPTSLATPRQPSILVTAGLVHKILHDPYYRGMVTFKGAGIHPRVTCLLPTRPPGGSSRPFSTLIATANTNTCATIASPVLPAGPMRARLLACKVKSTHSSAVYPHFVCLGRRIKHTDYRQKAVVIEMSNDL